MRASFTIRVSRRGDGTETDAIWPAVASFIAFAFWIAGITVRMFVIPTCGLFGASGRFPVAQPKTAGAPVHVEV